MKAVQICKRIKKIIDIEKKITGEVHSVYCRAFNIISENNELITVLSNEKFLAPNSILLNKRADFYELGVPVGVDIIITKKEIIIDSCDINIGLTAAKDWDAAPIITYNKASEIDIFDKLKVMEKLIFEYGKLEGIAPILFNIGNLDEDYKLFSNINTKMNQYSMFIIHRLIKFLQNVSSNQIDKISDSVKQIIGFGPGLTPSMDDYISGMMLSLIYLSSYFSLDKNKILNLNKKIVSTALNKTTRVSEEMLKFSSVGESTESNREFIISILSDSSNEEFINKFMNAIKFGDTSGTDTLCGIYFGFRILLNEKNREVFVNGA